jgi:hypothetical protein
MLRLLFLCFFTISCQTYIYGKKISDEDVKKIIRNKSTQADLEALFGAPNIIDKEKKSIIFIQEDCTKFLFMQCFNKKTKYIEVFLNNQGKVKDFVVKTKS